MVRRSPSERQGRGISLTYPVYGVWGIRPVKLADGSGPNSGRFGTLGRNTFRGPDFHNFDFALIKTTPLLLKKTGAEAAVLQFRAEFFNLFNIVNFGLPANILTGSGFGEISRTAGTSRQIQFSLKMIF